MHEDAATFARDQLRQIQRAERDAIFRMREIKRMLEFDREQQAASRVFDVWLNEQKLSRSPNRVLPPGHTSKVAALEEAIARSPVLRTARDIFFDARASLDSSARARGGRQPQQWERDFEESEILQNAAKARDATRLQILESVDKRLTRRRDGGLQTNFRMGVGEDDGPAIFEDRFARYLTGLHSSMEAARQEGDTHAALRYLLQIEYERGAWQSYRASTQAQFLGPDHPSYGQLLREGRQAIAASDRAERAMFELDPTCGRARAAAAVRHAGEQRERQLQQFFSANKLTLEQQHLFRWQAQQEATAFARKHGLPEQTRLPLERLEKLQERFLRPDLQRAMKARREFVVQQQAELTVQRAFGTEGRQRSAAVAERAQRPQELQPAPLELRPTRKPAFEVVEVPSTRQAEAQVAQAPQKKGAFAILEPSAPTRSAGASLRMS